MKKIIAYITLFLFLMGNVSLAKAYAINNLKTEPISNSYDITMKQDILCLMMAYPEFIADVYTEAPASVYLVMKSGRKVLYDDKKAKNFSEKLANPDLQDMMEQTYPMETTLKLMDKNFDPGRFRVYSLLSEVYGGSREAVEHNLINVSLGYRSFQFNRNNNAAASLKAAMAELIPIASKRHNIAGALFPSSGTFNYRLISGTGQLSPHSFGIAIDLARDNRDYWQWASREEGQKRLNTYPKEVVDAFQKHNFVWGGKWAHFDTLHFEYRPEIILKARYFGDKNFNRNSWYEGVPIDDALIKTYIEKIDKTFKFTHVGIKSISS